MVAEELSREQFRQAVADAAIGIVNLYAEVDKLFRELGAALRDQGGGFVQLGGKVVPGGGRKNPDARYLRNFVSFAYAPALGDEPDDPDDGLSDGEDDEADDADAVEEVDEDEATPSKKKRTPLLLAVGSSLIVARVAVYQRGVANFEPNLRCAVLSNCRAEPDKVKAGATLPTGTTLRVSRNRFRGAVRAFVGHHWIAGKPLRTGQPVQVEELGKGKQRPRLVFDIVEAPLERPLYDMNPAAVRDVAGALQATWRRVTSA